MSNTAPNNTGADTDLPKLFDTIGASHIAANTPRRAIDISKPIAIAISLPLNHLAIALDTVVPAISQPQPKIMKPKQESLADAGNATHQELSHDSSPVPTKYSLIA